MAKRTKTKYPNIFSYELKKGTFYLIRKKFKLPTGGYKDVEESGFKTLSLARSRLREIEDLIEKESTGYIVNKEITLNEWWNKFTSIKINSNTWTPDTEENYREIYNKHIVDVFGHTPMSKISRLDYTDFINDKLNNPKKNYSKSTVTQIHKTIMSILNEAVYYEVLQVNKLNRTKIQKDEIPKVKKLEIDEFKTYMETAFQILPLDQYAMIYLTTWGLRKGEVMGVQSSSLIMDSNGKTGKLHIKRTRTKKSPDGKSTKNPSSTRIIQLSEHGTQLLQNCIESTRMIYKNKNKVLHQDDFIFINKYSTKPYTVMILNSVMRRVKDKCGIHAHPHLMRHNFATQAILENLPNKDVSNFLGHSSMIMTDHYTHGTVEGEQKIVNKIDSKFY